MDQLAKGKNPTKLTWKWGPPEFRRFLLENVICRGDLLVLGSALSFQTWLFCLRNCEYLRHVFYSRLLTLAVDIPSNTSANPEKVLAQVLYSSEHIIIPIIILKFEKGFLFVRKNTLTLTINKKLSSHWLKSRFASGVGFTILSQEALLFMYFDTPRSMSALWTLVCNQNKTAVGRVHNTFLGTITYFSWKSSI